MESALSRLALASPRAPGLRSFQILKRHDELRLRAFFLSFDFDQRRAYFGGGMSDPAIREYCETIDWENMTIIARSGPACIDAVIILASLPPAHTTAKLSLACPLSGNQAQVVRELLDLAIDVAALRFRKLISSRELANPELLALLRKNQTARFNCEHVEIHLDVAMQKVSCLKPLLTTRRPQQNHTGDDRAEILSARDAKGRSRRIIELVSRSHRALRKLGIVVLGLMLNGVHLVPHRASRAAGPLAETSPDASHPSNEFSTSMPLPQRTQHLPPAFVSEGAADQTPTLKQTSIQEDSI
jgi:hypothetical protein